MAAFGTSCPPSHASRSAAAVVQKMVSTTKTDLSRPACRYSLDDLDEQRI